MLIYDTNTTNSEGKNTFDLRVQCEWVHYKLHKNAWLVGIGPSKQKLWLIELEQITTKHICMDVINLRYEHDKLWGEKHFGFKCAMWMSSLQGIYKCLTCCNWTYQTKVMGIELEQITTKPICMDVSLRYEHDKLLGKNNLI